MQAGPFCLKPATCGLHETNSGRALTSCSERSGSNPLLICDCHVSASILTMTSAFDESSRQFEKHWPGSTTRRLRVRDCQSLTGAEPCAERRQTAAVQSPRLYEGRPDVIKSPERLFELRVWQASWPVQILTLCRSLSGYHWCGRLRPLAGHCFGAMQDSTLATALI